MLALFRDQIKFTILKYPFIPNSLFFQNIYILLYNSFITDYKGDNDGNHDDTIEEKDSPKIEVI